MFHRFNVVGVLLTALVQIVASSANAASTPKFCNGALFLDQLQSAQEQDLLGYMTQTLSSLGIQYNPATLKVGVSRKSDSIHDVPYFRESATYSLTAEVITSKGYHLKLLAEGFDEGVQFQFLLQNAVVADPDGKLITGSCVATPQKASMKLMNVEYDTVVGNYNFRSFELFHK